MASPRSARVSSSASSSPSVYPSSSSSPSVYPSSYSSVHSPPRATNLAASSWSPSYRSPTFGAHDQLESLIARHGHPTRVSLSSLEELTATSATNNPPSPASAHSDLSDTLTLSRSTSRPIPIPRRSPPVHDTEFPVTPLTGRFDKGYYFAHREERSHRPRDRDPDQARVREREGDLPRTVRRRPRRPRLAPPPSMRSDSTSFYAPVVSPSMSPTTRPESPQPSRSRAQNTAKSVPAFHLGSLPRFHPAVYQSSGPSSLSSQPPSPRQSRQNLYRTSSSSRDTMWHYRDIMEGVGLPKTPSRPLSPSPSAPRLDPLRSPGPVTPLALEDASGYLLSGPGQSSMQQSSGPAPDLVERLIAREHERARQQAKKSTKTR